MHSRRGDEYLCISGIMSCRIINTCILCHNFPKWRSSTRLSSDRKPSSHSFILFIPLQGHGTLTRQCLSTSDALADILDTASVQIAMGTPFLLAPIYDTLFSAYNRPRPDFDTSTAKIRLATITST